MGNGLLQSIADNVVFVLVCVGVAAGLFAIAYAAEKYVYKRDGITERILSTRKITMIGLFSALAMILHIFDFPVLFWHPGSISWISVRFRRWSALLPSGRWRG